MCAVLPLQRRVPTGADCLECLCGVLHGQIPPPGDLLNPEHQATQNILPIFFLQITICPPLKSDEMLKSEELGKHDLVYGRDFLGIQRGAGYVDERIFTWKSRNGTLSAEDVQDLVLCNDVQYFFFNLKLIDNYILI